MRLLAFVVVFYLCSLAVEAEAGAGGGADLHTLKLDGLERSYLVYRPQKENSQPMPLMIVLHGGLGNAKEIEAKIGMDEIADAERLVVVYPNGTPVRPRLKNRCVWNAGDCCGPAVKRNVDDVGFIKAVIEQIQKEYAIDSRRVYIAGISNGAMMAYRVMSEIPERIAAVVAVAGTLAVDGCDAAKDVPVLHIHGTGDTFVPIAGGSGENSVSGVRHRSLADTVGLLTKARNCTAPQVHLLGQGIEQSSYTGSNGAPVQIVLLQQGTHAWPGGHGRRAQNNPRQDFKASRFAWDFVSQYSKK